MKEQYATRLHPKVIERIKELATMWNTSQADVIERIVMTYKKEDKEIVMTKPKSVMTHKKKVKASAPVKIPEQDIVIPVPLTSKNVSRTVFISMLNKEGISWSPSTIGKVHSDYEKGTYKLENQYKER